MKAMTRREIEQLPGVGTTVPPPRGPKPGQASSRPSRIYIGHAAHACGAPPPAALTGRAGAREPPLP